VCVSVVCVCDYSRVIVLVSLYCVWVILEKQNATMPPYYPFVHVDFPEPHRRHIFTAMERFFKNWPHDNTSTVLTMYDCVLVGVLESVA